MSKLLIITLLLFTGCSKNKTLASDCFQNGLNAYEKKEYEKALSFFLVATELNPNEPKYLTELVSLYSEIIQLSSKFQSFKASTPPTNPLLDDI